jgi:hypothetical protein
MRLQYLPLALLLYIQHLPQTNAIIPSIISRAAHKAHRSAIKHSRGLAGDLRVAFQAVLVETPPSPDPKNRAVYCSVNRAGSNDPFGTGINTGSNSSSTSTTSSSTSSGSSASHTSTSLASPSQSASPPPSSGGSGNNSPWKLVEKHAGSDFFNGWDFFTIADPTHGIVDFVDESTGRSNGLLSVNGDGNAIMSVETTDTVADVRKSIRIQSKSVYNGGLFIMDAVHMPTGCGTWPAFWTNGPNWPTTGEIDIVEGVHDYTHNQATIHTESGCNLPSSSTSKLGITGNIVGGTDCAALTTGNQGCGVRSDSSTSFGAAFNQNGGGVYALSWDADGLSIWFFSRGDIPSDLSNESPNPDNWGRPMARWPSGSCNTQQFFKDHSMIFDTTLCGDWAGGVWNSAGIPGQEQSCAQRTGFSTCEEFVRSKGSSFTEAYWEVKSVKVYTAK